MLAQQILALNEAVFNTGYSSIYWTMASGFPKAQNVSKAVDRKLGYERQRTLNSNQLNRNKEILKYGFGDEAISDEAISDEAKKLSGAYSGFQPKPAVEIILVAMRPLSEKTYVEQAMKNGKGITWLDSGRIPFVSKNYFNSRFRLKSRVSTIQ